MGNMMMAMSSEKHFQKYETKLLHAAKCNVSECPNRKCEKYRKRIYRLVESYQCPKEGEETRPVVDSMIKHIFGIHVVRCDPDKFCELCVSLSPWYKKFNETDETSEVIPGEVEPEYAEVAGDEEDPLIDLTKKEVAHDSPQPEDPAQPSGDHSHIYVNL